MGCGESNLGRRVRGSGFIACSVLESADQLSTSATERRAQVSDVRSFEFVDKDSGQSGYAAVRVHGAVLGLALSLEKDGDIEYFSMAPRSLS